MKCKNCKKELKKEWKFCPYCGNSIGFFRSMFNRNKNHEIEREMEDMLQSFGLPGIKISFKTHNGSMQEQEEIKNVAPSQRKVEIVEEPEVKIKKTGNEIYVEVILPDVNSIEDIFIRRFEESMEIRAYSGKKMYFKVIPITKRSQILKKILEKHKLKLVLSR